MIKLTDLLNEVIEEKDDRCLRIARRKYDKPSAYRSGAIVRCRRGEIWKGLSEDDAPKGNPKSRVLDVLNTKLVSTLSGTSENKLIKKLIKDVTALDGEELKQYIRSNFLDRKNSWKARLIFASLLDAFEGKEK